MSCCCVPDMVAVALRGTAWIHIVDGILDCSMVDNRGVGALTFWRHRLI